MKKYIFLIKNSFLENSLHPVSVFFAILEPIIEIIGFIYLYSYIGNNSAGINPETLIYFVTILAIMSIRPKNIMSLIKKEFKEESFLTMNQRPINPFLYYLAKNIGNSLISIFVFLFISVSILIYFRYPIWTVLLFVPVSMLASVLLNMVYFGISTLRFRLKYFNNSLYHIVIRAISGSLIPIAYYPAVLLTILKFMPFIYTSGLLARDITEKNLNNLILNTGIVVLWAIGMFFLVNKLWYKGSDYYQEKM